MSYQRALLQVGADGERLEALEALGPIRALALYADTIPPSLTLTAPIDGALLNDNIPAIELACGDIGSGVDPATLSLKADGADLAVSCTYNQAGAACTPAAPLPEGPIVLTATVGDHAGNLSDPAEVRFTIDTIPPVLTLTVPADGLLTNQAGQRFVGSVSEAATLTLDGETVPLALDRTFDYGPLLLQEGMNTFTLVAEDAAGSRSG